jgi:hypothetical protein
MVAWTYIFKPKSLSHGYFVSNIAHLNAMNQGSAASNGCNDMNRFCHFGQVRPLFKAGPGIGIDTIRALDGMGDCQRNEGFFAFGQFAFSKYGIIILEEFMG